MVFAENLEDLVGWRDPFMVKLVDPHLPSNQFEFPFLNRRAGVCRLRSCQITSSRSVNRFTSAQATFWALQLVPIRSFSGCLKGMANFNIESKAQPKATSASRKKVN
jgi:hypothetical protein